MKVFMKYALVFIILITITTGCSEKKIVNPTAENTPKLTEELVPVQVDLFLWKSNSGDIFTGYHVLIKFNNIEYYKDVMSNSAPLAGPMASFTVNLSRGSNNLYFSYEYNGQLYQKSIDFNLGDAEKYYIGIDAYNDRITIKVQENIFLYA